MDWEQSYWDSWLEHSKDIFLDVFLEHSKAWILLTARVFETGH